MSEQENFWGMTFSDFCRANPRESFEALRPRYLKIQEENKLHNEQTRRKYLARLEADKAQKRLESEHRAARAALAREAAAKRQFRYKYATMTEAQYDDFWPEIYREILLDEANRADAEMRRDYQF